MLALVGSGEYLPAMEPVDRELIRRLPSAPRVVCLPTAAGIESPERIAYWSRLGVEHFARLGVQVETVPVLNRADANDMALAAVIAEANFVYLSGGKPDHLYKTLVDTPVWEAIQAVLGRGGLLAGCSAGAMIMGEKLMGFPARGPGFNLLPGTVIMPHYDEIPRILALPLSWLGGHNLTLVGIEGNTALVYDGETYEVLGSGGVTIWNQQGKTRYTQGRLSELWPGA